MTLKQKNNLIAEIVALLEKSIVADEENPKPQVCNAQSQPLEMLTVKECSQVISGLSEHTVRQIYFGKGRGTAAFCPYENFGRLLFRGYFVREN